jgi:hypothetical protein
MMYAILVAVVRTIETVVGYSLAAIFLTLGIFGVVAVCRWCVTEHSESGFVGREQAIPRTGSGSLALAAVLVIVLGCALATAGLWTR